MDNDYSFCLQELPVWYNSLIGLPEYPVDCVDLITDSGYKWSVVIESNAKGHFICQGWVTVVIMIAVEENDLILFENVDFKTFKLKHMKSHYGRYLNPMFYYVMVVSETKKIWYYVSYEAYLVSALCRYTRSHP
ncbi:putative transcription factor B3-Domain family [Helianthus anomalus]